jgi:electron transport complex protein RnfG
MKKIIITILVAALILFGTSFALQGTAAKKAQEEHLWLMQTLLPMSETFTVVPYDGEDANIRSIHKADNGYVIETVVYGYADNIRMLVGVSNEGLVTGLVVREAHETVGLGNNALTDHEFLAQFLNSSGSFEIATNGADAFSGATGTAEAESGESVQIDGITGATVTSKAVARSVNSAVGYVTGADAVSSATTWGG